MHSQIKLKKRIILVYHLSFINLSFITINCLNNFLRCKITNNYLIHSKTSLSENYYYKLKKNQFLLNKQILINSNTDSAIQRLSIKKLFN